MIVILGFSLRMRDYVATRIHLVISQTADNYCLVFLQDAPWTKYTLKNDKILLMCLLYRCSSCNLMTQLVSFLTEYIQIHVMSKIF
jgi:hypothetical protein